MLYLGTLKKIMKDLGTNKDKDGIKEGIQVYAEF